MWFDKPIIILLLLFGLSSASFLENGCPSDFSIHYLLPHETDCDRFYSCSNGQIILHHCPQGTLFDASLPGCNDASVVSCQSTQTTEFEDITNSGYLPNGCPADFSVHLLLPHETDCDKFYSCSNGNKTLMTCGPGTLFDFYKQVCNHESLVDCQRTTTRPADESNATTEYGETTTLYREKTTVRYNGSTSEDGEATTETIDIEYLPNGCPTDFHIHYILPHESDCSKFYKCAHGEKVLFRCPPPLLFDINLKVCNWERYVYCPSKSIQETTEDNSDETTMEIKETTDNIKTTDEPTNAGTTTEIIKPQELTTRTETTAEETTSKATESVTEHTTIIENSTNTKITDDFYTTEYTTGTPTTPAKETVITTKKDTVTTASLTTEGISETTLPQTTPSICPEGFFGNVPHPERCDAYYLCSGWSPILLFCPAGYEFDTHFKTCVPISKGGCTWNQMNSTTTVTPNGSTTTGTTDFITEEDIFTASDTTTEVSVTEDTITEKITIQNQTTVDHSTTPIFTPEETTVQTTTESLSTSNETNKTTSPISTSTVEIGTSTTTENWEMSTKVNVTTDEGTTEIPPTQPPICPDGFFGNVAHPELCNAYYLCSGWTPILLYCPRGFEFDREISDCVPIAYGGCTWLQTTTTAAETEQTTIEPLLSTIVDNNSTIEIVTNVTTATTETVTTASVTTERISETTIPQTTPSICPDGFFGNVPHPERCDAYYLCSGWSPILLFCPADYEFDTVFKTCIPISKGGCTWNQMNPSTTTVTPNGLTSTGTTDFITEEDIVTASGTTTVRSVSEDTTLLLSTEQNTTDVDTEIVTTERFTSEHSTTLHPSTDNFTIPIVTPDEITLLTTTEYSSTSNETNETTTPISTSTDDVVGTTELPTDFTTEENNTTGSNTTPEGSVTEETTTEKVTTQNQTTVDPSVNNSTTPIFTPEETTIRTTTESLSTSNETNKTTSPISTSTVKIEISTTTENWEMSTKENVTADEGTTELPPTPPPICPDGFFGNVAHPELCNAYYLCSGWIPILLYCPRGFEFDREIRDCVPIAYGGCTWLQTTTTATETEQTTIEPSLSTVIDNNSTMEIVTDVTTATTDTVTTASVTTENISETTLPQTTPSICPDGFFGNVPHPERCDAYYLCSGWNPILLFCPVDYEFDTVSETCVPISKGGCTWNQMNPSTTTVTPNGLTTTGTTHFITVEDVTTASDTTTEGSITEDTTLLLSTEQNTTDLDTEIITTEKLTTEHLTTLHPSTDKFTTPIVTPDEITLLTTTEYSSTSNETNETTTPISISTDDVVGTTELPTDFTTEENNTTGSNTTPEGSVTEETTTEKVTTQNQTTVDPSVNNSTTPIFTPEETTIRTTTENLSTSNETNKTTSPISTSTVEIGISTTTENWEMSTKENVTADEGTTELPPTPPPICPDGFFGNVAHPELCNAYYLCSGWIPILLYCPRGFEFDREIRDCVPITYGGCTWLQTTTTATETEQTTIEPSLSTVTDNNSTIEIVTDVTTATTDTVTTASVTTETISETTFPETTPSICPDGFFGNVPHPERCDAYYLCSGWNPILLFCPADYEFDTVFKTCIPISKGGCTWNQMNPSTTTVTPNGLTSTGTTYFITEEDIVTASGTTTERSVSEDTTLLLSTERNSTDVDTEMVTTEKFTTEHLTTLHPSTDNFTIPIVTPDETTLLTTTEYSSTSNETNETTTAISISTVDVVGTTELTTDFPTEENYTTNSNTTTEGSVIEDTTLLLSTEQNTVDVDTEITTTEHFTTQNQTTIDPSVNNSTTPIFTPEETTIRTTTESLSTSNETNKTTSPISTTTENWEMSTKENVTTDEGTTEIPPTQPPICPDGFFGNVAHPELCNAYYLCSGWTPILLYCPRGFEFDREIRDCVPITYGGCTWLQTTTTATETEQTSIEPSLSTVIDNKSTIEIVTDVTKETTDTVTTASVTTENISETTIPQTTSSICPDGFIGNVPHPERCDAYYLCLGLNPILLFCPENFEYDSDFQVCVPITHGGCTWLQSTTTVTETEKTTVAPSLSTIIDSNLTTTEIVPEHTTEDFTADNSTVTNEKTITTNVVEESSSPLDYTVTTTDSTMVDFTTDKSTISHETTEKYTIDLTTKEVSNITTEHISLPDFTTEAIKQSSTPQSETTSVEAVTEETVDTEVVTNTETSEAVSTDAVTTKSTITFPETVTTEAVITDAVTTKVITESANATTEAQQETATVEKEITESQDTTQVLTTEKDIATTERNLETTTNIEHTTATAICPDGFFGMIANPNECDAYYMCSGWMPIPLRCSAGFEFSPDIQNCVKIAEGGCTWHLTSTVQPFTDSESVTTILTTTSKATTKNAETTTVRTETVTFIPLPPNPEPVPDVATTTTVPDVVTTTKPLATELPTKLCPENFAGMIPHPERCDAYYLCSGWDPILLHCSSGFEFDPLSNNCVVISDIGCTANKMY